MIYIFYQARPFSGLGYRINGGTQEFSRYLPVANSVIGKDLHPHQTDGKLKRKGTC